MTTVKRVLIVDEDTATHDRLREPLTEAGFEVDSVRDGFAAIQHLQSHSYAAVLLELVARQGLNGFTVLNFIEAEQPAVVADVFLVTAMTDQTVLHVAPALVRRFFRKPFDTAEIVRSVVEHARHQTAAPTGFRALIADDDGDTRKLLGDMVRAVGIEVHEVADGRSFIDALANDSPDVILLDLMMPGVDGFALVEYLKTMKPLLLPRVIVITAVPENYLRSIEHLVGAVVTKPVDVEGLRAAIAGFLN